MKYNLLKEKTVGILLLIGFMAMFVFISIVAGYGYISGKITDPQMLVAVAALSLFLAFLVRCLWAIKIYSPYFYETGGN